MKFISLFAGVGGFDLGLERAGMTCVAQVEIDEWCRRVLSKHWPNVPKYGDIKNVGKQNLPTADLIAGGFPCQPHSVAGKRKGAADDRNLWPEYLRIIKECQPRWVIGENVPGIISTYLDTVLSDLESEGYETATLNIPACGFDAPHRRERIFVVANADGRNRYGRSGDVQMGRQRQPEEITADGINTGTKWLTEPSVGRVANGVPHRLDRLRGLGNAVVPQVAEFLGRILLEVEGVIAP